MIVFPIVAAGTSAFFAVALYRQWSSRRRLSQLAWCVALAMYAIASTTVVLGTASRWDATLFRLFWLFGVMLNVVWLALGSLALLGERAVRIAGTIAVAALTLYAVVLVASGHPDREVLRAIDDIPRGAEVWPAGTAAHAVGRWYSIGGWLVVVAIALLSSRPRRGLAPPRARVRANVLVAAAVTVVAIGGFALSRIGGGAAVAGFSVSLAAGVTVMFAGFLLASRAPRYRVEDPGESPT